MFFTGNAWQRQRNERNLRYKNIEERSHSSKGIISPSILLDSDSKNRRSTSGFYCSEDGGPTLLFHPNGVASQQRCKHNPIVFWAKSAETLNNSLQEICKKLLSLPRDSQKEKTASNCQ